MKTIQINPIAESISSIDGNLPELKVIYQYPEAEYIMASGGSTQVLGDFLEFTDYLVTANRINCNVKTEEFYSAFTSLCF